MSNRGGGGDYRAATLPPRGRPRARPGAHSSSPETLERQRAKITLPGTIIPTKYAAEPDNKPKCYGDLYRAEKERAGTLADDREGNGRTASA
jgi:hypothetical protein